MWQAIPVLATSVLLAPGPTVVLRQEGTEQRNPARSATSFFTVAEKLMRFVKPFPFLAQNPIPDSACLWELLTATTASIRDKAGRAQVMTLKSK